MKEASLWASFRKGFPSSSGKLIRLESPVTPGFPDAVAFLGGSPALVVMIEAKVAQNIKEPHRCRFRPEQVLFHRQMTNLGQPVYTLVGHNDGWRGLLDGSRTKEFHENGFRLSDLEVFWQGAKTPWDDLVGFWVDRIGMENRPVPKK